MLVGKHTVSAFYTVNCGGYYSSGIAGPLAAGINSLNVALQKFVTQNSYT